MPIEVLKDAFFSINAVDLSDRIESLTLNYSAELQEATAMGDASRRRVTGLKDWSIELTFRQDFDASQVDATLFPLVGTEQAVVVRKSIAVKSATNPEYTGSGIIESYPPISGAVGEVSNTTVTIQGSNGVALARGE